MKKGPNQTPKPTTIAVTSGKEKMRYECPSCGRQLISRLGPNCCFCGVKVPPHLLFSKEERARIETDERMRKERQIREAELKKAAEATDYDVPPSFDF